MKNNELSAKIKTRFKKSKDFDKLINQLQKEKYTIKIRGFSKKLTTEKQKEEYGFDISMFVYEIIILKNNNRLLNVLFENNFDPEADYKQKIITIYN